MSHNQFDLLHEKRFLPFFVTMALGALNDNIFKNALIILLAYTAASKIGMDSGILVNLAAILFILPFFLFSAVAGQLADKYEKSRSIHYIKFAEIIIMGMAVFGFYSGSVYWLFFVLFLMGFQSAIFGPIKFGYLPQHLKTSELVGGNGLVEMGTFLAILIGTIVGGILIALESDNILYLSLTLMGVAAIGFLASLKVPKTPAVAKDLKINWNIFSESKRNLKFARSNKVVFLSILGISWFWFYGAVYLAQIPEYAKTTLAGKESVATLLLTAFSLGIGIGATLCEKLSNGRVEVGLVPVGAIGLSVFGFDLYAANPASGLEPILSGSEFLAQNGAWRVLIDATFIGISGGLFTVPLYAQIQKEGNKEHMSRLFAGLNIMNAFFMVLSGVYAIAVRQSGYSIPELFMITGIINGLVAIYIFTKSPEYIFRFITWLLVNTIYRIRNVNLDVVPKHGPCVLVCNHVSFIDALIIAGYCKRNVRFVMYHKIFKTPIIGTFFKMAKAIPIAPAKEDPEMMNQAFDKIAAELEDGEVVCIFPEGKLTPDGEIGEFKKGIEKIIERTPVPVVPMALTGLWGSWFSRFNGTAMKGWPRKFMAKIHLVAGKPIAPEDVDASSLQEKVEALKQAS